MSFRLVSIPLKKRNLQEERENELIVDNIHGNIGISTLDNNDKIYKSGTEKLKSDLESLKIRNKLMNDNLINISYGSENNVENKDFEITNALENKDILGSLQYLEREYDQFIDGIDEDGNVILKESSFKYSDELKKILKLLYDLESYSYSDKFRKILEDIYVKELNNEDTKDENGNIIENNNDENFSFLKLQKLLLDYIPHLYNLESKIFKMERIIETINEDLNINIEKSINNIRDDLKKLKYNTKTKKFNNDDLFDDKNNISYYQTENENSKFKIENENIDIFENLSKIFEENFVTSFLDDNYDGDINLHKIDGIYNDENNVSISRSRMTGNYFTKGQDYYYIPTNGISNNINVVYDPILKKPIYRYNTIPTYGNGNNPKTWYKAPYLEFYLNDNNYILQNIELNKYFKCKNTAKNNSRLHELFRYFYFLFNNNSVSDLGFASFIFPSLYNLNSLNYDNDDKNEKKFYKDYFDYDYFVGLENLDIGLLLNIEILSNPSDEENQEENPSEETKVNYSSAAFWLIRDTMHIYNEDTDNIYDDYIIPEGENITKKGNNRFENNNKNILSHIYYTGIEDDLADNKYFNKLYTYNKVKNHFNIYIDTLKNKLSCIANKSANNSPPVYPNCSETDIVIGSGEFHRLIFSMENSECNLYAYNPDINPDNNSANGKGTTDHICKLNLEDGSTTISINSLPDNFMQNDTAHISDYNTVYTINNFYKPNRNFAISDAIKQIVNTYNNENIDNIELNTDFSLENFN